MGGIYEQSSIEARTMIQTQLEKRRTLGCQLG
jgi:hypothetical protein